METYIPPARRNKMESAGVGGDGGGEKGGSERPSLPSATDSNFASSFGPPVSAIPQNYNQNFHREEEAREFNYNHDENEKEKREDFIETEKMHNASRDRWSKFQSEEVGDRGPWGAGGRRQGGGDHGMENTSNTFSSFVPFSFFPLSKLRVVEIDSLVLIKVFKHCKDNYPTAVNGQMLGMEVGDVLEVTNCFALPQKKDMLNSLTKTNEKDIEERVDEEIDNYQDKTAELMHDLNIDCFTVGWYQTLRFGDLKNKNNIDSLVLYQEILDKAILLGFDPLLHAMGKTSFKGFRVSEEFLAMYHEAEEDVSKYNTLKAKDILVEVPIQIKVSLLGEAYLLERTFHDSSYASLSSSSCEFDALELDQNNYLEKNLNFLSDCLEELSGEQEKLCRYQRDHLRQHMLQKQIIEKRRLENEQRSLRGEPLLPMEFDGSAFRKIFPPSQIHTLLMSNQAAMQCKEIAQIAKENLGKMFLLNKTYQTTMSSFFK